MNLFSRLDNRLDNALGGMRRITLGLISVASLASIAFTVPILRQLEGHNSYLFLIGIPMLALLLRIAIIACERCINNMCANAKKRPDD